MYRTPLLCTVREQNCTINSGWEGGGVATFFPDGFKMLQTVFIPRINSFFTLIELLQNI